MFNKLLIQIPKVCLRKFKKFVVFFYFIDYLFDEIYLTSFVFLDYLFTLTTLTRFERP